MKIFVSYTSSDREWAHWIAWQLREAGHEPFVHEWEIGAGQNIPRWMEERLGQADRMIGLFSDSYCKARRRPWSPISIAEKLSAEERRRAIIDRFKRDPG